MTGSGEQRLKSAVNRILNCKTHPRREDPEPYDSHREASRTVAMQSRRWRAATVLRRESVSGVDRGWWIEQRLNIIEKQQKWLVVVER